jgi:Putative addiction module component
MKFTIEIREDKISFFLELIRNFNFVKLEASDKPTLTPEHLAILEERLAAYEADPDNFVTWDEVRVAVAAKRS